MDDDATSQARLDGILNSAMDAIIMIDQEQQITLFNPAAERMFRRAEADVLGQALTLLLPARYHTVHRTHVHAFGRTNVTRRTMGALGDITGLRGDGTEFPIEAAISQFEVAGQKRYTVILRDITERKQAEARLRESEAFSRAIFESSPDCVNVLDMTGHLIEINNAGLAVMEIDSFQPLAGRRWEDMWPQPSWPELRAAVETAQQGEIGRFQGFCPTAKGTPKWWDVLVSPIRTADGATTGLVAVSRDITERRRAEEQLSAANTRLEQSNRELQDFAYVASHDLQEPLRKIQAFGDRLESRYGPALGADGQDYLARMQRAAGRMQTLISDLLSFSRITARPQPFELCDLAAIAREVVTDLEVRITQTGGSVQIGVLPSIEADPLQMRQLLQNLIGNALKFHQADRAPVVTIAARIEPATHRPDAAPICQIQVIDNGIGFDEKYLDRIFTPFQRLYGRDAYEGTGMGLAICRRIAERHGGSITASSAPNQGATFMVHLPVLQPNS